MGLKETLSQLDEMVPAVPRQVADVVEEAGRFKQSVEDLLEKFEEVRTEAGGLMEQVQQALTGLREQAGEQSEAVNEALGAVETAVREAVAAVDEGRGNVEA